MVASGPALFERLNQKPYKSHYFYVEAVIDQHIERVWSHALRIDDWMTDHRLETVAGKPTEIGHFERVYPCDIDPNVPKPHYILYGIAEIVPLKCIALEVFPEKGGSFGDAKQWMAFDSILFSDLGGKTRIAFLQIHVSPGESSDRADDTSADKSSEGDAVFRQRLLRYFDNLRRLSTET